MLLLRARTQPVLIRDHFAPSSAPMPASGPAHRASQCAMFDAHHEAYSSCLDSTVAVCPTPLILPVMPVKEVDHYWPHVTMFSQGVMRFENHIQRMLLLIQCVIKLNLSSVWSANFKVTLSIPNIETHFWLLSTLLGVLLSRPLTYLWSLYSWGPSLQGLRYADECQCSGTNWLICNQIHWKYIHHHKLGKTWLLAPQSAALRINAYRDFHPTQSQPEQGRSMWTKAAVAKSAGVLVGWSGSKPVAAKGQGKIHQTMTDQSILLSAVLPAYSM